MVCSQERQAQALNAAVILAQKLSMQPPAGSSAQSWEEAVQAHEAAYRELMLSHTTIYITDGSIMTQANVRLSQISRDLLLLVGATRAVYLAYSDAAGAAAAAGVAVPDSGSIPDLASALATLTSCTLCVPNGALFTELCAAASAAGHPLPDHAPQFWSSVLDLLNERQQLLSGLAAEMADLGTAADLISAPEAQLDRLEQLVKQGTDYSSAHNKLCEWGAVEVLLSRVAKPLWYHAYCKHL